MLNEGGKLQKNSKLLTEKSSSRIQKNSPIGLTKDGASMVGGMFAVIVMSCWQEKFIEIGTGSRSLGTVPWCAMATCSVIWKVMAMVVA